jgi:hypothetical protein
MFGELGRCVRFLRYQDWTGFIDVYILLRLSERPIERLGEWRFGPKKEQDGEGVLDW